MPEQPPIRAPADPPGTGGRPTSMAPERDTESALSRLVDALLDKGVYLDLDLLVTVAGVPLIAVNLRATIAGVETMMAYGIPGPWSEGPGVAAPSSAEPRADPGPTGTAWLEEHRATGPVWREGSLSATAEGGLRWVALGERRASLLIAPEEIDGAQAAEGATPSGTTLLLLRAHGDTVALAVERPDRWIAALPAASARREDGAQEGAPGP